MAKVYLVYERVPYAGIEDVLHVFTTEKEAEKVVEWYREKYKVEYGEYDTTRYRYMIRDLEEEFKSF